jgi:hypothetical protein
MIILLGDTKNLPENGENLKKLHLYHKGLLLVFSVFLSQSRRAGLCTIAKFKTILP